MNYRVTLFSPDTHVVYDGNTPDRLGIGGGVTSRVRLLKALAHQGHTVTAYVNCLYPGVFDGVDYRPFQEAVNITTDIFLFSATGGDMSLAGLHGTRIDARLKAIRIGGVRQPAGFGDVEFDVIYPASNFLRDHIVHEWNVSPSQVFVCYSGLNQECFAQAETTRPPRDPFALVYLGHPSKGLDDALLILRELRARDPRFRLDVYGGYELWGEAARAISNEPGVNYLGLVNQIKLASLLFGYTFCLAPQRIPEGFGNAVQDAKRAGIVVIASAVGVFPELIEDGYDGVLINLPGNSGINHEQMVNAILELANHPDEVAYLSRNAMSNPLDWNRTAQTLTQHWEYVLANHPLPKAQTQSGIALACPECRTALSQMADGLHCLACGLYFQDLNSIWRLNRKPSRYYGEIGQPEFRRLLSHSAAHNWRQAALQQFGPDTFMYRYITQEGRGRFHFLFDLTPDSQVLELGAGYGTVAASIAHRCHVTGLDNTFLRLAFAEQRRRQEHIQRLTLIHGTARSLPFEPDQFDLVTMVGLLEWAGTDDDVTAPEILQSEMLREAHRVLRPGGFIYIGIENRYGFKYLLGEPDDHTGIKNITFLPRSEADIKARAISGAPYRVRTHSRQQYEDLLHHAGFIALEFYGAFPDYRLWNALVPLDVPEPVRHYLEQIHLLDHPSQFEEGIANLQMAAGQTGTLSQFVDSFAIIGQKGNS